MVNAREILNDFVNGVGKLSETNGDFIEKFVAVDSSAGTASGAISDKTKELIGVALGVYNRCQYSSARRKLPSRSAAARAWRTARLF